MWLLLCEEVRCVAGLCIDGTGGGDLISTHSGLAQYCKLRLLWEFGVLRPLDEVLERVGCGIRLLRA